MFIYIYTCIYIDTTHFLLEKCGGFTLSTLMYLIYVRELFGWYILIFIFACRTQVVEQVDSFSPCRFLLWRCGKMWVSFVKI